MILLVTSCYRHAIATSYNQRLLVFLFSLLALHVNVSSGPRQETVNEYVVRHVYIVTILKVFKGEEQVKKAEGYKTVSSNEAMVNLYTPDPTSHAACGVTLPRGEHLVTGKIWDNELNTEECDWQEEWSDLTAEQQAGVEGQYPKSCSVVNK